MSEGSVRILYIEDDAGLAHLVARALGRKNYAVEHVTTGAAGLARLAEGGIDVVALDHYLGAEEGLGVLERMAALPHPPPVIYVTGSDDSRVAVAALKAGAADYVWKDTHGQFVQLLVKAIEDALAAESLRRAHEAAEREVREARDRAELLLREVNHRVANSLSLVGAMVRMQANGVKEPAAAEALDQAQARIVAIAALHRRLYTSDDVRFVQGDAYLQGLVEELETTMKASGGEHGIRLRADPIAIPTDKAVSVGVIVTELVTNAFKYAYPAGGSGEVRVAMQSEGEGVTLTVEDDGVGLQDGAHSEPRGTGLGGRIVRAMASNLRAPISYLSNDPGTRVQLRFTL